MAPLLSLLLLLLAAATSGEHIQAALRRGDVRPKGVNLGGWLVAERWMTYDADIWRGVPADIAERGEFATMQFLGHAQGDARFEAHRATWITEPDIAELARFGLNAVRVPVGFWIREPVDAGDDQASVFAPGALTYLDRLVNDWAVTHNVAVLLSLHAHRGSQNGKDHSASPLPNVKQWSESPANRADSAALALFLAARYRASPAFLGMSLMNEPEYPTAPSAVVEYYTSVHSQLRARGDDCVLVLAPMLSEQAAPFLADVLRGERHVWIEWHPYYKWGYEGKNEAQLIGDAAAYGARVAQWAGNPLTISEWSLGVWDQYAPFADPQVLRAFGQTQLASFGGARAGFFFWSWRHADDARGTRSGWSMRGLLRAGVLAI
jgi:glucan 1,3-beta-glucosidase